MTPEAWTAFGTAVTGIVAAVGAIWGRQAKDKATEASERSKPTSNGFAAGVKLNLAEIQTTQARQGQIFEELMRRLDRGDERMTRIEGRLDRLTDHLIDDGR